VKDYLKCVCVCVYIYIYIYKKKDAFKIRIGQATKYFENHSIRKTFFMCKTLFLAGRLA